MMFIFDQKISIVMDTIDSALVQFIGLWSNGSDIVRGAHQPGQGESNGILQLLPCISKFPATKPHHGRRLVTSDFNEA